MKKDFWKKILPYIASITLVGHSVKNEVRTFGIASFTKTNLRLA